MNIKKIGSDYFIYCNGVRVINRRFLNETEVTLYFKQLTSIQIDNINRIAYS
jgi:hypothetical protein